VEGVRPIRNHEGSADRSLESARVDRDAHETRPVATAAVCQSGQEKITSHLPAGEEYGASGLHGVRSKAGGGDNAFSEERRKAVTGGTNRKGQTVERDKTGRGDVMMNTPRIATGPPTPPKDRPRDRRDISKGRPGAQTASSSRTGTGHARERKVNQPRSQDEEAWGTRDKYKSRHRRDGGGRGAHPQRPGRDTGPRA